MNLEWNYKIDLVDVSVFDLIEENCGMEVPEVLKKLVIENNAAIPNKGKYMLKNEEMEFGALISFNKNEDEVEDVFHAIDVIGSKELLPFAIDSFGNYLCIDLNLDVVVFWDHENDAIVSTEYNFVEFMGKLY